MYKLVNNRIMEVQTSSKRSITRLIWTNCQVVYFLPLKID